MLIINPEIKPMRSIFLLPFAAAALLSVAPAAVAQSDTARAITDGGIKVPGWKGTLDPNAEQMGQKLSDAKLSEEGGALHIETGPAVTYWKPSDMASGDYTVKATFTEPKYMDRNSHPHPYGIVIAGNDMGTPQQTYLYCAAYGSGNFIVRGFGPAPFQVNGRRGEANAAVHKASGPGQSVSQEIAMTVKGNSVSCAINGTTVGTYDKSSVVGAGKLKSTDGVYGIRSAHNTDVTVTGLTMTKE
jgi:hypothetical protein